MLSPDMVRLFAGLPGADLVVEGLGDLALGRETVAGELVKMGSRRLQDCGVVVQVEAEDALEADRRLYRLLGSQHGNAAHSRYNALVRELVSFERALEQRTSRARRMAVTQS
jgi:hypothetical protein